MIAVMTNITCQNCGKIFQTTPVHSIGRKSCSVKCKAILQKGNPAWNLGLTKLTDKRVAKYGKSGSITIKKQFKDGRKSPLGMTGKNHTAKHILWLKERNGGKNNSFYGKKHSTETKAVIRMKTINNIVSGKTKTSYTTPEVIFYNELDTRKINYIPQYILNNKFAVDVYLPDIHTLVQIDGDYWHNLERVQKKDKSFNAYAKKCGYRLLRFWEHDIHSNIGKCIDSL